MHSFIQSFCCWKDSWAHSHVCIFNHFVVHEAPQSSLCKSSWALRPKQRALELSAIVVHEAQLSTLCKRCKSSWALRPQERALDSMLRAQGRLLQENSFELQQLTPALCWSSEELCCRELSLVIKFCFISYTLFSCDANTYNSLLAQLQRWKPLISQLTRIGYDLECYGVVLFIIDLENSDWIWGCHQFMSCHETNLYMLQFVICSL